MLFTTTLPIIEHECKKNRHDCKLSDAFYYEDTEVHSYCLISCQSVQCLYQSAQESLVHIWLQSSWYELDHDTRTWDVWPPGFSVYRQQCRRVGGFWSSHHPALLQPHRWIWLCWWWLGWRCLSPYTHCCQSWRFFFLIFHCYTLQLSSPRIYAVQ